MIGTIKRR